MMPAEYAVQKTFLRTQGKLRIASRLSHAQAKQLAADLQTPKATYGQRVRYSIVKERS